MYYISIVLKVTRYINFWLESNVKIDYVRVYQKFLLTYFAYARF